MLFLVPACAGRYAAPAQIETASSPNAAYDCVKRQLSALGYKQTSNDVDEHRVTGTKYDTEARRADVQFRRLVNRLEVQVGPGASGQTSIDVQSHTYGEYTTQRGPTEVEEPASDQLKQDAQKLLESCRG
jgi:hypothetical protein